MEGRLTLKTVLWISIPVLLFLLFTMLQKELEKNNVFRSLSDRYRLRLGQRLKEEQKFYARYGHIENTSYLYQLDRLLLNSGLRGKVPWLSAGSFLLVLGAISLAGLLAAQYLTGNLFAALFAGASILTIGYAVLFLFYGLRYNRIEEQTALFVSILMNYARSSSDIVTIMDETSELMDGPIRELIRQFLRVSSQTGNVDLAFDYMKESVDNRQLQMILVNLKNCMHYQANYEEVLQQMSSAITANLSAREERKNILFSMKVTLIVISIASVVIALLIGAGLGIDVKGILTQNAGGQFLLFLTGILYLVVLLKLFGIDKQ